MTEQFDILDINGNPTGLMADKGTVLQPGQFYLGTHVYVHNAAMEFLIQQRAYDKKFNPGGWYFHCEHTMAGETSVQCAARGLREELGLSAPESAFRLVCRTVREEMNHIADVFFLQIEFDITKLNVPNREVIAAKTISSAEMIELVLGIDWTGAYMQTIIDEINFIGVESC